MTTQDDQSLQETFLKDLEKVIQQNLSNENFGTNELAKEIGLSRSQIFRKLKKINNKSISQLIREMRLEEALKLLERNVGTAAEIAYKTGFSSPSYFNKCFHEYFGITPGDVGKIPLSRKKETKFLLNNLIYKFNWRTAAILSFVLLGVWLIYYLTINKSTSGNISETKTSIAVLPFINLTGETSLNHLQYGISELIINALSTSDELTIIDNQTITDVIDNLTNIQKGSILPDLAKEIAERVNVKFHICGNYMYEDSTLRISLKLIDTKTGEILKTNHLDGKKNDIFYLAGSLSNDIKSFLEIKILDKGSDINPLDFVTTSSPKAFKYYIIGMESFWKNKGNTIPTLKKALEIDSNFTSAHFFLGLARNNSGWFNTSIKSFDRAYKNKEKAPEKLKLWLEAWNSEYTDKDPFSSISYYRDVEIIDPLSRMNLFFLGYNYFVLEKYNQAIREWEKIINIDRQLGGSWKFLPFYTNLGTAYHKLDEHRKEKKIYKEGLKLFPENQSLIIRQAICAVSQGNTKLVDKYITNLNIIYEKQGKTESHMIFWKGHIYMHGGKINKSEEFIRQALAMKLKEGEDANLYDKYYWYYHSLARVLISNDINVKEGVEYAEKALKLFNEEYPDYPWFLNTLGWGYYKQGKYTEALHLLKKAEVGMPYYDHTLHLRLLEVEETIATQKREN